MTTEEYLPPIQPFSWEEHDRRHEQLRKEGICPDHAHDINAGLVPKHDPAKCGVCVDYATHNLD